MALDKLLVTEPDISCRVVVEEYGIPKSTFKHRKKMRLEGHNTKINQKPLGPDGKCYLTDAKEQMMGIHIDQSSRHGNPPLKLCVYLFKMK